MWSSRPVGPVPGGSVAVGVALLFGSGVLGFYSLNTIARPTQSAHTPNWSSGNIEEDDPCPLSIAPPPRARADVDSDLMDLDELADLFPIPTTILGALPVE